MLWLLRALENYLGGSKVKVLNPQVVFYVENNSILYLKNFLFSLALLPSGQIKLRIETTK
jgi:hypothetical protein